MTTPDQQPLLLGLIGKSLSHSFSKKYFDSKFSGERISHVDYRLFPLEKIEDVMGLVNDHMTLKGFNVTIPYKQSIIPFLDKLDPVSTAIGAVNTVKISRNENETFLVGYNTDEYGFRKSLETLLDGLTDVKALILGTGGASKAVQYVLNDLNIGYQLVSRSVQSNALTYHQLSNQLIKHNRLIINTTPVGMFPKIDTYPPIPNDSIGSEHYLFDLVYNPEETMFIKMGKSKGAKTLNGLKMLHLQAERSWKIWKTDLMPS